jgi:hypothetical protein
LNDPQTSSPPRPEAREQDPQPSVGTPEAQASLCVTLQNGQLVTKREDLGLKSSAGSKTGGEQSKKSDRK